MTRRRLAAPRELHIALEVEAAMITAELEKSPSDPTALPGDTEESGLGDVEAQIRWRFLREGEGRPDAFTYFETVFPLRVNTGRGLTPNATDFAPEVGLMLSL